MIILRITRGQLLALWAIVWGSTAGGRDKLLATLDATIDALPPREATDDPA